MIYTIITLTIPPVPQSVPLPYEWQIIFLFIALLIGIIYYGGKKK